MCRSIETNEISSLKMLNIFYGTIFVECRMSEREMSLCLSLLIKLCASSSIFDIEIEIEIEIDDSSHCECDRFVYSNVVALFSLSDPSSHPSNHHTANDETGIGANGM